MNKYIAVAAGLVVVAWAFFGQSYGPKIQEEAANAPESLLPSISLPSLTVPNFGNASAQVLAWKAWEDYLGFAKAHDLEGLRSVSYQLSAVCNDQEKIAACFGLMDSVSAIAGEFSADEFKYVESDAKQIIMYTDGPEKKFLYFTRSSNGAAKVLGLKICVEDENNPDVSCESLNADTEDDDNDGWWNSVEALFYK